MTGVTIDHYELIEELGAGGMGKVYKARDLRLDRLVALKILFGRSFSEQDRLRFIQEAKTASALNHPNIITVYEVVSVSGNDVIVMELIEGRTLGSVAREKPGVMALLPIFRQIAEALSVAHAAGIVHRDIKPDNIMVRADGYVKVLDFGLARLDSLGVDERTATLGLTEPGAIIGTLRYMSPEQVRGETVGPAADIFSLGITLFEVLTGQHAFSVSSSLGVLNAILVEPARPAARINPEIPAVVDDLISRMLSKEPVLRPTASEIQQTLASLLTTGNAPWTPLRTVAQPARSSVGREEEHSALREAFSDASAGAWSMICVAGEPGLGKTTLVEDFLRDTQTEFGRAWVTTGRCSERLSGAEALLPWLESLEHLIRGDRGDEAARLLRRYAPAWFLLVAPGMGDATREAVVLDAKTPSHELMRRELVAFLEQLCRVQPLILFFDDVHWADASTCDLLSYIAAKAQGLPMLVAATYRPAMLMASRHPFLQVKLQLQGRGCCREVPLRFLTRSDVERYAARVFPQHQFPSDFFEVIHSKTEGNPLFMTDMLRYLRDRKSIVEQEGRWALVEPLSHVAKEIPSNIRGMIQMKMDALGEDDRQLLVAGATQGVEFDSAVAANVLNRDPIDVEERLQLLETTSDFVRAIGENEMPNRTLSVRYRFVHVFYQNAMYASLTPSRRAALSRNVARTLVEYHGQRARSLAGELAALFDAARDFPEAAKYYLFASRNAARVFAYPEAAILAKKGLEAAHSLPDSPDRAQLELPLSLTLGVSQMATLGYSAPEVLQTHLRSRDLCRKANDTRRMVPILWGLWTSYLIGGQIRNSLAVAEEMMQISEASGQPLLLIQALHAMGTTAFYIGTLQESQKRLERLLEIYDPRKHDFSQLVYLMDPVVSAHSMLSRACMLQGSIDRALNHGRQAVSIAEASAHVPSIAYAHFFLAWVLLGVGEYAAARDSAARSMKISAEHGNTQTGEWGRILYGASISHMGDPQGVIEMRQSLAGQAAVYSRIESGYCSALLAEGLAALGRFDEALEVVNHGLEMAVGLDENAYIPEILRLKAEVLLAKSSRGTATAVGESERTDSSLVQMAEDELRTSIDFARSSSARLLELQAWCSLLRLKQLTGETTEVKRELAQCLASFTEGLQSPHLRDARVLLSS